jgi:hypothetical protein
MPARPSSSDALVGPMESADSGDASSQCIAVTMRPVFKVYITNKVDAQGLATLVTCDQVKEMYRPPARTGGCLGSKFCRICARLLGFEPYDSRGPWRPRLAHHSSKASLDGFGASTSLRIE